METGKILIYCGNMYASKTSELIREYNKWKSINKQVIMINHIFDNRYGDNDFVYSHDLIKVPCIKTNNLNDISNDLLEKQDVILINEGQFFTDLLVFCKKWCDEKNKNIIVCGLDGDFRRKPFGQMNELISIADDVIKLKSFCSYCSDGTPAIFTHRSINNDEQIVIGSTNYKPVCRKHYLQLNKL